MLAMLGALAAVAYSNFKVTHERAACSQIVSALQLAKMRAISTGNDIYVDFDINNNGAVGDMYTVYSDTDSLYSTFGEKNNSNSENEFTESNFPMPDCYGTSGIVRNGSTDFSSCSSLAENVADTTSFFGVALPEKVSFGKSSTMGTNGPTDVAIPTDGVSASGERIKFTSRGISTNFGSIYLYDTESELGVGCAAIVSSAGVIRRSNWDGANWDQTW